MVELATQRLPVNLVTYFGGVLRDENLIEGAQERMGGEKVESKNLI